MENNSVNQYQDIYMDTSTTSTLTKGLSVVFAAECMDLLYDLRWMILLAIILIIADFWFGMNASKVKGIPIRRSRAGRRTINKLIDYLCYILLGAVLGKAVGEPYGLEPIVVSVSALIICYGFEIDSIYGHICTLHGIEKKYSIWKIIWLIISFKFTQLSGAFKDMSEQSKNYKQSKNSNNEDVL